MSVYELHDHLDRLRDAAKAIGLVSLGVCVGGLAACVDVPPWLVELCCTFLGS